MAIKMQPKKIAIAFGGNALADNPLQEREQVKAPARKIANLASEGHKIIIGHGNGPQVGMIANAFYYGHKADQKIPMMPFPEVGGMSQGYIGFHLQTAIQSNLREFCKEKDVTYLLTQTIVDKDDPNFKNPTKPIGPFFSSMEAARASEPEATFVNDAGRGYRKVVASPRPQDFISFRTIKKIFENGDIVIAAGGGGIPTVYVEKEKSYKGVDGVIDKDFAISLLAQKLDADLLVILTSVNGIYLNYNKPNEHLLIEVDVATLEKYIANQEFSVGSMLPKVQATIDFVKGHPGRVAIIAALDKLEEAINGQAGTRVVDKL